MSELASALLVIWMAGMFFRNPPITFHAKISRPTEAEKKAHSVPLSSYGESILLHLPQELP